MLVMAGKPLKHSTADGKVRRSPYMRPERVGCVTQPRKMRPKTAQGETAGARCTLPVPRTFPTRFGHAFGTRSAGSLGPDQSRNLVRLHGRGGPIGRTSLGGSVAKRRRRRRPGALPTARLTNRATAHRSEPLASEFLFFGLTILAVRIRPEPRFLSQLCEIVRLDALRKFADTRTVRRLGNYGRCRARKLFSTATMTALSRSSIGSVVCLSRARLKCLVPIER